MTNTCTQRIICLTRKHFLHFSKDLQHKSMKILIFVFPFVIVVQLLSPVSLRPHGLQHARFPCPSPSPGIHSSSCPLNWWCHTTISSSITPFSSCLQSFPASWSFLMSRFSASGGQSIGASVSASVLSINIQGWFPLGLTGLISLLSKGLSRIFSNTTVHMVQLSHPYMSAGKTIALTRQTFVGKTMSLLFNKLSRFIHLHLCFHLPLTNCSLTCIHPHETIFILKCFNV